MEFHKASNDFMDKWNLADDGLDSIESAVALTFYRDPVRNIILSKYRGRNVYRDRAFENIIREGETWLCTLTLMGHYYFAKAVHRVDGAFLMEMRGDQIEDIVEIILTKHRDAVEPLLEEKYKEITKKFIGEKVAEAVKEKEEHISELNSKIEELEGKDKENRQIISSLEEKVRMYEMRPPEPCGETIPNADGFTSFRPERITVERIGPDEIYSESFCKTRYFVHISADYRILVVRPHENGDVVCMRHTMMLNGLNMVLPFSERTTMISEYSPEYGGIVIYLR